MIQPVPRQDNDTPSRETEHDDRYLPARMINELVYCPRLFYLMHVEGQFESNAETVEGDNVHQRVDGRTDPLAARVRDSAASADAGQLQLPLDITEPDSTSSPTDSGELLDRKSVV